MAANRLNLEDNSENVKIGKALHEEKEERIKKTEITIENVKIDGLTDEYLIEIKKSDADIEASKWQIYLYLKMLKDKGIVRKGKLEIIEKKKQTKKVFIYELTPEIEIELEKYKEEIQILIEADKIPKVLNEAKCKKCAYYEYCYI